MFMDLFLFSLGDGFRRLTVMLAAGSAFMNVMQLV